MSSEPLLLLAKSAKVLVKLRQVVDLSEWAVGASGQEDADELVEYFGDVLDRDLLLDYWDSYLSLIHYCASINPRYLMSDFTAFLIGIGILESDVDDENKAQHALQIGRQQLNMSKP